MATLLSSLPIGTPIKFGKHVVNTEAAQPIVWVVADKNRSGYPSDSVTLLAQKVIDLRAYDASEGTTYVEQAGSNNYVLSNLHQWLNSSAGAGEWYTASHSKDAPPTAENISDDTAYHHRAGFLYNFLPSEISAMLSTTVTLLDRTSTVTTKVFLPSRNEVGLTTVGINDGSAAFPYIVSNGAISRATAQVATNTLSSFNPGTTGTVNYWLRSTLSGEIRGLVASNGGTIQYYDCSQGHIGVRPIVNLSGSLEVSTVTDSDGCYTLSLTNAPSIPSNVQFTTKTIYTSKPCTFKWNKSTDPNGDTVTYKLHLYYNDVKEASPIDVGTATTYTLSSVKSGVTKIGFSVEALDPRGHSNRSAIVSANVLTNYPPVISGTDGNLGSKTSEFTFQYTVTDSNSTAVTVKEYIDNIEIRSFVPTLGATNNISLTGNTWLKITNGVHSIKIVATDGIDTTTRTYSFTKAVYTMVIQRTTPITFTNKPTRLIVTVVKNIPPEATFKVEACNNGFDASPTWEDITSSVKVGQTHVFSNTTKTASNWGINIRVTVNRNGGEGACYVTEIGGNFE